MNKETTLPIVHLEEKTFVTLEELSKFASDHPNDHIRGIDISHPPTTERFEFVLKGNSIGQRQDSSTDDWNYLDLHPNTCGCSCHATTKLLMGSELAEYLSPFVAQEKGVIPVTINSRLFVMSAVDADYRPVQNSKAFRDTPICPIDPKWAGLVLDMLNTIRNADGSSDTDLVRSAIEKRLESLPDWVGIDLEFIALGTQWITENDLFRDFPLLPRDSSWRDLVKTEKTEFGPKRTLGLSRFLVTEADLSREFGDPIKQLLRTIVPE